MPRYYDIEKLYFRYMDERTKEVVTSEHPIAELLEHTPGFVQWVEIPDDDVPDTDVGDQEAKSDAGKLKLTLVPRQIIRDIAEVREYGNRKYPEGGPENWRRVQIQRYRDALYRHLLAYLDDPDGVDPESGIKHYKHMACNMAFICEMERDGE